MKTLFTLSFLLILSSCAFNTVDMDRRVADNISQWIEQPIDDFLEANTQYRMIRDSMGNGDSHWWFKIDIDDSTNDINFENHYIVDLYVDDEGIIYAMRMTKYYFE